MPSKPEGDADADAKEMKRYRSAMEGMAEEFVCPITHELPLDPVIAEDGQVYERLDITRWLEGHKTSPLTNAPMGSRLLEATRVRNAIEKLVRSGAVQGSKAEQWRRRLTDEEEVAELRQKAEGGDASSMYDLGLWYVLGCKGLPEDEEESYRWYQRAADLGHVPGLALAGVRLVSGKGVSQNERYGICLVGRAAALGSDYAAFYLGAWHKEGMFGLPKSAALAKEWLKQVVDGSCAVKHAPPFVNMLQRAAEHLEQLDAL